ncbi:MAG: response regulator [Rhodospirillales bacterium]|nr:response regulator [Rhodospirillales bacterium]
MPDRYTRVFTYWGVGLLLTVSYFLVRGLAWQGSAALHTLMEAMATLLAIIVGAMALVRYYSKKDGIFLIIGAGFLGTGFLDGYHALVTSAFFRPYMPSDLPALIPWSWVASRQFLSVMMVLSWLAWIREKQLGKAGFSDRSVYAFSAVFTITCFLFFAFTPLPRAYYPEYAFHRPEEFGPALFFLIALVGYLRKGRWRNDSFEHWLVLSLIVGFISQAVFMSYSGELFDFEFDAAHTLKKVSYLCVLTGLFLSMYADFRREENTAYELKEILNTTSQGYWRIDNDARTVEVNPRMAAILGLSPSEAIGTFVDDYLNTEQQEIHKEKLRRRKEGLSETYELVMTAVTGQEVPCLFSATPLYDRSNRKIGSFALVSDITKLKENQTILEISIQEAEEANRAKSEFLSSMSHELRTPMNAILGFGQLLELNNKEPLTKKQKKCVDQIMGGGKHLLGLIDDVLDLAKIEAGKLSLSFEGIGIGEVGSECLSLIGALARERGVTIDTDVAATHYVKVDYTRFKQILLNLLSNAIKYNRNGGTVTLTSEEAPDHMIRISVKDTGTGIAEGEQTNLFEPFNRLGRETSDIEGTGVGLTVTKKLTEAMKGRIGFESKAGTGSTFWVEFFAAESNVVKKSEVSQKDEYRKQMHIAATVLYIEDNPANLQLMETIIDEIGGISMMSAHNAELGILMAEEQQPDLILMDINLPGMDGIAARKALGGIDATKDIPVVAISAAAMKRDVERGMAAGFKAYLTKPFNVQEVVDAIEKELSV